MQGERRDVLAVGDNLNRRRPEPAPERRRGEGREQGDVREPALAVVQQLASVSVLLLGFVLRLCVCAYQDVVEQPEPERKEVLAR